MQAEERVNSNFSCDWRAHPRRRGAPGELAWSTGSMRGRPDRWGRGKRFTAHSPRVACAFPVHCIESRLRRCSMASMRYALNVNAPVLSQAVDLLSTDETVVKPVLSMANAIVQLAHICELRGIASDCTHRLDIFLGFNSVHELYRLCCSRSIAQCRKKSRRR